ncbi:MAG TPA: M20/M25/M40 family metallo-hydrolase [Sedimentibacter sp.]|jgi:arginine utilization protein RocB|nr:M20/M25/M40 family metallo-hydrolase [Sedimentibacter sp.]HOG62900.1 M20/M25/M40 family metallo-hydrolase [Sedimentibacter sp.]HPB79813.1 M20/M25/M40 family metallo-hydrolase [Sedimentibacter sp.]HPV85334.1 M20/M25/M40 family metallo-hydrolase [Sedimentibacter sp.]HQC70250.1 M20/M25/M40 family metallo-hydrolase [Sedimentibacter sp.]
MANINNILKGIEKDIEDILFAYVKTESFTNTINEKKAEEFFLDYFSKIPYFKNTPGSYGIYEIENDALNRNVSYAFLKGRGQDTIVFIHHNDIVGVEDFKLLKKYAFSPKELKAQLLRIKNTLSEDAKKDLEDDTFIFGRGVCDMKGGGSIQIALLKRYSELENFNGNIVLIAVPDEENLSAGMRSAVRLLSELQDKYNLKYKLMINTEPHQRKDDETGVFSEGSVGKIMPFVYVRGYLAHAGKVFEGLNPIHIMSKVVSRTELNMDFSDVVGKEAAPPPTWLYLKDSKEQYDVSMPLSVKGCFGILTLNQTPQSILEKVKNICEESFDEVIDDMNNSFRRFAKATGLPLKYLQWESKVVNFQELFKEAEAAYGDEFIREYNKELEILGKKLKGNEISIIHCNFELIEFIYGYIDDIKPRIVYGLIPPYYPNVSNLFIDDLDENVSSLCDNLIKFTQEEFNQNYNTEYFYTGISDLSYSSIEKSGEIYKALEESMPLLGQFYNVPVELIEKISMPCINIGPWGKDFHKMTERVNKEDLYIRTPRIINKAISLILGN